uniref:Uncharacterized protein n=1 Tax=Chromera velia CCMP2878 TaxID=1169474 RepID=A0A0G4HIV7_9ALVE|eukprot:Cvel_7016.t1-p1 / transcript=Cvel_7016.t1 / gene=Cvel_7016 / organism=Chromera_velia_CCMP2878 / gene_product=hypothetical protein / transcript_product=hypothetical protein / location=Cvel_scaffold357:70356-70742(-) / protein_length=129 / sequence_SO=supercontig / SO=protein_coding / is_pseudo=false
MDSLNFVDAIEAWYGRTLTKTVGKAIFEAVWEYAEREVAPLDQPEHQRRNLKRQIAWNKLWQVEIKLSVSALEPDVGQAIPPIDFRLLRSLSPAHQLSLFGRDVEVLRRQPREAAAYCGEILWSKPSGS